MKYEEDKFLIGFDQYPEFVPVKAFSKALEMGWKMVDGCPLHPGDYAVLMVPPPKDKQRKSTAESGRVTGAVAMLLRRARECA